MIAFQDAFDRKMVAIFFTNIRLANVSYIVVLQRDNSFVLTVILFDMQTNRH